MDDIINVKNFDSNNIKIDEKSYKNIFIQTTLESKIQNT